MGLDVLYPNLKQRERVLVMVVGVALLQLQILLLQKEANPAQSQREENPSVVRNLPDAPMRVVKNMPNEGACASVTGLCLFGSDVKLRDVRMASRNEDCVGDTVHMRVRLLRGEIGVVLVKS